eukprot:SAG11_NODE_1139_length_5714_cov_20.900267_3_plen_91_part_00
MGNQYAHPVNSRVVLETLGLLPLLEPNELGLGISAKVLRHRHIRARSSANSHLRAIAVFGTDVLSCAPFAPVGRGARAGRPGEARRGNWG